MGPLEQDAAKKREADRKYRLKLKRAGRCWRCKKKRGDRYAWLCDACMRVVRERAREKSGSKPWRIGGPGRQPKNRLSPTDARNGEIVAELEKTLGILARDFRATRRKRTRVSIAKRYAEVVTRLVAGGRWKRIPPLEDQLPDEWMPDEFLDYWSLGRPKGASRS